MAAVTIIAGDSVAGAFSRVWERRGYATARLGDDSVEALEGLVVVELEGDARWDLVRRIRDRASLWVVTPPERASEAVGLGAAEVLVAPVLDDAVSARVERWLRRGLLAQALDEMDVSVEITHPDGRLTYVNRAFERETGYARDEVMGRTPAQLLRSDLHADGFFDEMWSELESGRTWRGPLVGRRRDGRQIAQQACVTPLLGADGAVAHLVAVKQSVRADDADAFERLIRGIERRETAPDAVAARLRASQRKYRALVEWADDGILIADFENARVVEANPAACRMWGYELAEFAALRGRELHPATERKRVDGLSEALRTRGWAVVPRMRCRRKDGSEFWARIRVRVFDDGHHRWEVSFVHDVTNEVEREQALLAESRLAATGRLAAGVAHDVNSPAGYVALNIEMVQDGIEQLADVVPQERLADLVAMLSDCADGVKRIQSTMSDLSSFARVSRSSQGGVDLGELVRMAARHVRPVMRHHARLELEVTPIPTIRGDANQLVRVLTNLLINAAEAFPEGPVDEHLVTMSLREEEDEAVIRVVDNGPGMQPELVENAFEPFVSTKRSEKATGLGLWLCRQIVDSHGGSLSVKSALGAGTAFEIRLPMQPAELAPVTPPVPDRDEDAPALRFLLVDDEPNILRAFARVLSPLGDVVTALGGGAALELLEGDTTFDVVLCDVMMPDMDGAMLYEVLLRDFPALAARVVFCTGGVLTPRLTTFLEDVPNGVLAKPLSAARLRAALLQVAAQLRQSP